MLAIVQNGYGGTEVLRASEVDRPAIAGHEVLVRTRAAGVDRGVGHLMAGEPYVIRLSGTPKCRVVGMDLAGTVVAVGKDVTGLRVGDDVFGVGRGSFAEFTAAGPDKLAARPDWSRPAGSPRRSAPPTRSRKRRRPSGTWQPDRPGARSPSRSERASGRVTFALCPRAVRGGG